MVTDSTIKWAYMKQVMRTIHPDLIWGKVGLTGWVRPGGTFQLVDTGGTQWSAQNQVLE